MGDLYNLEDVKKKSKKSEVVQELDKEIKRKAEGMERESSRKAKSARLKLEKAEERQKRTTDEMRRQNEKLENARQNAFSVYEHAGEAEKQAVTLDKDENAFDPLASTKIKYVNWANQDVQADEDVRRMKERTFEGEPQEVSGEESFKQNGEYVEGEKKTNKELFKILKSVKNITRETDIQSKEGQTQETKLKDILKTGDYAGKKIKKADERLKDNL